MSQSFDNASASYFGGGAASLNVASGVRINLLGSNESIDLKDGKVPVGVVQVWDAVPGDENQSWEFHVQSSKPGVDFVTIRNPKSGAYIRASKHSGGAGIIASTDKAAPEVFERILEGRGHYKIKVQTVNPNLNLVFTAHGKGKQITLEDANKHPNQDWVDGKP